MSEQSVRTVYKQIMYTSLFVAGIGDLFLGVDPSDCPLPCRTFSTEVKFFSKLDELVGFGLFFLPTVEVDKAPLKGILWEIYEFVPIFPRGSL